MLINDTRTYATMPGELERGREYYAQRKWADAYDSLSRADQAAPLAGRDLELLAMAAYLVGRDEDYLSALERAHQAYLDAGESVRAVRCAFWLGMRLFFRGETGRATGWFARAQRLLERETHECAERGYLLLPVVEQQLAAGDYEAGIRDRSERRRDRRTLRRRRPDRLRPAPAGSHSIAAGAG